MCVCLYVYSCFTCVGAQACGWAYVGRSNYGWCQESSSIFLSPHSIKQSFSIKLRAPSAADLTIWLALGVCVGGGIFCLHLWALILMGNFMSSGGIWILILMLAQVLNHWAISQVTKFLFYYAWCVDVGAHTQCTHVRVRDNLVELVMFLPLCRLWG